MFMRGKLAVGYEKFFFAGRAGDLVGAHSLARPLISSCLLVLVSLLERRETGGRASLST